MKNQWRIISLIILVVLVAVFAILNGASVPISFGLVTVHWPLVMVILGALLVGALLMFLLSSVATFQANRRYKALEARTDQEKQHLASENQQLKLRVQNGVGQQELGRKDKEIEDLKQQIQSLQAQLNHASKA